MMSKQDILKKIMISCVTLLLLTGLLFLVFRNNLDAIADMFMTVSISNILWLCSLGVSYQLLDSLTCWLLLRTVVPTLPYHQALNVIYLGVFGKISTFSTGTLPLQAYYLYHCGIEAGRSIGIMTFNYTLHKVTVILYATVLLLFEGTWFYSALPDLRGYLIAGYIICLTVISALILLCTSHRAHDFAILALDKLPNNEKWNDKKRKVQRQLDCLFDETSTFMKNKRIAFQVISVHTLKLVILCMLPYLCLKILGVNSLSLLQVEMLSILMFLIASAAPNVAGMGPTEAVFFLMYSPLLGSTLTSSSLFMYRIATYYFPFIISIFIFLIVQTKLLASSNSKEVH